MKKYLFFSFAIIILTFTIGFLLPLAQAQTPTPTPLPSTGIPLTGWAWSSNIGWISFDAAGVNGVKLSTTTANPTLGSLYGYAWSSNIGWIRFGGLSAFPAGSSGVNAAVNLTSGQVYGMVRACAGTVNPAPYQELPGNCASMNSRTDGWDGWIQLSGANHLSPNTSGFQGTSTRGVTLGVDSANLVTFNKFSGFAWGGDVVGWVQWMPGIQGVTCTNCNNPGTPSLTANCSITAPTTVTVAPSGTHVFYSTISGASGGTAPYAHTPTSFTLGVGTHSLGVTVTDASTPPKSILVSCGSVTVNETVVDEPLVLEIGTTLGNALPHNTLDKALLVKKGSTFVLKWENTLLPKFDGVTGYDCRAVIIPSDAGFSDWTGKDVSESGYLPDQIANKTGTFQFRIHCPYISNNSLSKSADSYLKVRSVSEGEI